MLLRRRPVRMYGGGPRGGAAGLIHILALVSRLTIHDVRVMGRSRPAGAGLSSLGLSLLLPNRYSFRMGLVTSVFHARDDVDDIFNTETDKTA